MDKIFRGRIWKMPDDVDTDTIIPGRRGTIPTLEEMGKYAFELLRPEFAAESKPGDIIVGGKNFGCGSSREQAPAVIGVNGVKIVIAKSFARIFFRNGFNKGLLLIECDGIQEACEDGDIIEVEVNKCVRVNGKEFPINQIPENLFKIVEDGGLAESTKKRNALLKQQGVK
ncbi:3-isopropylmalate dehydratase [Clostridium saccharobutylicum]|uniref:3-isopropylmalate dehydratase small subunit n=1 Tax=Clostridium saccharobutylicum TaxID=169679 RepID=A0A1S8MTJ4_CLOSA|nr:3-isopropylmalate dehydratase [Clostridium saccharobutylicum]OOM07480.1 homoaconitase small subunit [Clostridium saccharobutylicum]